MEAFLQEERLLVVERQLQAQIRLVVASLALERLLEAQERLEVEHQLQAQV